MAFLPAAAGKVRTRAHLADADGGGYDTAATGEVGGIGHADTIVMLTRGDAAAVVVHPLIRTNAYIARAAGAAVRGAISGALAASVVRLAGG